ncbi:MAG: hypothetical protein WD767_15115 [Alphaproteobacteria bacterium]
MTESTSIRNILDGVSGKRLLQGLVIGVVGTIGFGFGLGGWTLSGTVAERVQVAEDAAVVAVLAPICAERFEKAATAENGMVAELRGVNAWERNTHLMQAGWATFPGGEKPEYMVARECASLLNMAYKFE